MKINKTTVPKTPAPAPKPAVNKPEQPEIPSAPATEQKSEPKQPAIPREITIDEMRTLNSQQFVAALKQSIWVAECRRRGFGVQLTFNTKIEL